MKQKKKEQEEERKEAAVAATAAATEEDENEDEAEEIKQKDRLRPHFFFFQLLNKPMANKINLRSLAYPLLVIVELFWSERNELSSHLDWASWKELEKGRLR